MCLGSLLNIYIDLIRSISFDKNTGGDHPDISPASPGTFDLHLDTQDLFISKDKLDNFALCSMVRSKENIQITQIVTIEYW